MRALIFANGVVSDYARVAADLRADDVIICADGGLLHARRLAVTPHWLVGDLDSIEPHWLDDLPAETEIARFPAAKNETDLELALQRAATLAVADVLVIGVGGGRLDHALANILLLAQQRWPFRLSFYDGLQRASVLHGERDAITLSGEPGRLVSLLPMPQASGIVTEGLLYPLQGEALSFGSPRGISNVMQAAEARVQVQRGTLLVIEGAPD